MHKAQVIPADGRVDGSGHAASEWLGYPALPWESGLVFGPSASFAHGVNVDADEVSAAIAPKDFRRITSLGLTC